MTSASRSKGEDVASIAAGLADGMRRALLAMTEDAQFPGKATFNANGAHCLTFMRKPPMAEQLQKLTSSRANGRWRTAYRLTPLGLAVKAHLTDQEGQNR